MSWGARLAHLLDIVTLYLVFRAFNQPIGLGALVAGYAVGILFWIVSITPQGIGVVESVMALTFTSLGIPGAVAVALVFRGLTFWIPMLLGFFAVQRMQIFGEDRRILTETWGVRFAAVLVALMGIINMLSAATPSLADRLAALEKYSPLEVRHGGHSTAALSGFALLILADSLARRKRMAWLLTLGVLAISVISHLIKGLDYEEAALATGLIWYCFQNWITWIGFSNSCIYRAWLRKSVRNFTWISRFSSILTSAKTVSTIRFFSRNT